MAACLLVAFTGPMIQAVRSRKAAYFGGTVSDFNGAKKEIEGTLDTTNSDALIFTAEAKSGRTSAGGGNRTHTPPCGPGILSPIPPRQDRRKSGDPERIAKQFAAVALGGVGPSSAASTTLRTTVARHRVPA